MKSIRQITIQTKTGEPFVMKTEGGDKPATTLNIIEQVIDNFPYTDAKDILKGFKIFTKLEVKNEKVLLEDSDFEWVKEKCSGFQPILTAGQRFRLFFELFEEAETVTTKEK